LKARTPSRGIRRARVPCERARTRKWKHGPEGTVVKANAHSIL
jgi:hypothetical protein